jgi:phosphoglycerate dehydrogenase-like enzyme
MAVTLMLAAAKHIVPYDVALRKHDWRPRYAPNPAVLLEGKTVLVLGYGAIGRRVGRLCRGLGMEVIGVRREASPTDSETGLPLEALTELLPRADVLVITLPHTADTEGLIGKAELALLPPRPVVVNVGRGQVVDEEALYDALLDGTVHAAALDVWYRYPTDEDSRKHTPPSAFPFHELDNVVMSPHRAGGGGSEEVEKLRMAGLARLLNAAAVGEEMPNRVDVEAGY